MSARFITERLENGPAVTLADTPADLPPVTAEMRYGDIAIVLDPPQTFRIKPTDGIKAITALFPADPANMKWEPDNNAVAESDIDIYVDSLAGSDTNPGTLASPLLTLGEAEKRLAVEWEGNARINLIVGAGQPDYTLDPNPATGEVTLQYGRAVGPLGTPLVIRAVDALGNTVYADQLGVVTATANDATGNSVTSATIVAVDSQIGASLVRLSGVGSPVGTAVPIRGNDGAGVINAQVSIGAVAIGDTFAVQRPAAVIRATGGTAFNLYGPDVPEFDLALVSVKLVCPAGSFFRLVGARVQCDTCEWSGQATHFIFHGRLEGGLNGPTLAPGLDAKRAAAACLLRGTAGTQLWTAAIYGLIGGHLTLVTCGIVAQQGGSYQPRSLEASGGGIRIAGGGNSIAPVPSWGSSTNPARIRTNASLGGHGLFVAGGGIVTCGGPINLDVFACTGDGVRVETNGVLNAAQPGGTSGLRTTGANNTGFGLNARNGGRAFVGSDANTPPQLAGTAGQVGLDSVNVPGGWGAVLVAPQSNDRMSLVATAD